jgi:hypothetical protein
MHTQAWEGKLLKKFPLWRRRRRWKDNSEEDFRNRCNGRRYIEVDQNRAQ